MTIAIIGAGLSGLTLATRLAADHSVVVLEKARGPGGRMSTRRAEPYAFDHGAQYFTAETPGFKAFLDRLRADGLVAEWPDDVALRAGAHVSSKMKYVASPSMNAICKYLANDLDVRPQTHVESLRQTSEGWQIEVRDGASLGPYEWVVSTAPAVQTAALLPADFSGQEALAAVKMKGCFALMLGFDASLHLDWQAMKCGAGAIGFIAVNSEKPGRTHAMSLLVQSSNDWAETHLEDPPEQVKAMLLEAASELAQTDLSRANHQVLHRWRYAATSRPAGLQYLFDAGLKLAACGDWCLGGKVEAAFSSASALAEQFQSLSKA